MRYPTIHIPASPATTSGQLSFPSEINLWSCHKCGRKIVVQIGINGTPHHWVSNVVCAECMEIQSEFQEHYPQQAKEIEEWRKLHPTTF